MKGKVQFMGSVISATPTTTVVLTILLFFIFFLSTIETIPQIIEKYQPCPLKTTPEVRKLFIVTCDNGGRKPQFRSNDDPIDMMYTWNITSINLWKNGVNMTNTCENKSWEFGLMTKLIYYLKYIDKVIHEYTSNREDPVEVNLLYFLLIDSDTIWSTGNVQEIWNRFDCARSNKEILISTEMGCWTGYYCNETEISYIYTNVSQTPTFSSFINSGVILGQGVLLRDMFKHLLKTNKSYYIYDKRRREMRYQDQLAISEYALRLHPEQFAIDYHQQLSGSFAVHVSEGKISMSPAGRLVSKIVCKARNGSVDHHCKDLTKDLRLCDPKYFMVDDNTCFIHRNLHPGTPGYYQIQNFAPHPVIWHGNGQGKRTYAMLAPFVVQCILPDFNGSFYIPNRKDNFTLYNNCPCVSNPKSNRETHPTYKSNKTCFIDNPSSQTFLQEYSSQLYEFDIQVISNGWNIGLVSPCRAIIEVIESQLIHSSCSHKYICPESCIPKPYTTIPINWLTNSSLWEELPNHPYHHYRDIPITCTLPMGNVRIPSNLQHRISSILSQIIQRRVEECVEREYWLQSYENNTNYGTTTSLYPDKITMSYSNSVSKRKVFGLIIFVASVSRLDMVISQMGVLHHQWNKTIVPFSSNHYVAGWIASEEQYSCRIGTGKCRPIKSEYSHLLKESEVNRESFGWQCAQRRPLRALAHTLLLYDPEFIFIVDDDTFVNMKFFDMGASLTYYIRNQMANNPYVVGYVEDPQAKGGNKLMKQGIFYGGRGYLLGKAVLNRLQSYDIYGPQKIEDNYRSIEQMKYLSILYQVKKSLESCPKDSHIPCLDISDSHGISDVYNITAKSAIRLIDLCVNLFAKEKTCYHSDHSMTQCLAHGAYITPIPIDCPHYPKSKHTKTIESLESYSIGEKGTIEYTELTTCFHKDCNLSHSLSCHRYVYNRTDMTGLKRGMDIPHINTKQKTTQEMLRQDWCLT